MRRDASLINTARGAIVDQDALIEALEQRTIAGAGLDVYPKEPQVDPRLIALDNVMLLPHLGSATIETRRAMGEKVLANARAWAAGEELPTGSPDPHPPSPQPGEGSLPSPTPLPVVETEGPAPSGVGG